MANYLTLGGYNCLDPEQLYADATEQSLPTDFWMKANGYTNPLGQDPGEAWLLLANSSVLALSKEAFFPLVMYSTSGSTITVQKLMIHYACSITSSGAASDEQSMLVHLYDKRKILAMSVCGQAGSVAGANQYNVRYPLAQNSDTGTALYYTQSLNASAVWTWQGVLGDLWNSLPSTLAGTCPTLPYTPSGNPENLQFLGVSAWDAIGQLLAKLNCAIRYDAIQDVFTIVQLGASDSAYTSAKTQYASQRQHDYYASTGSSTRLPASIMIFFHRSDYQMGVINDAPKSGGAAMTPYYAVSVSTGATAQTGTVIPLWDDMVAQYSISSSGPTNSSALTTRANEVAANWVQTQQSGETFLHVRYNGFVPFLPGSQVKSVEWHDYGDGLGPVTEVIRHPGLGMEAAAGHGSLAAGSGEAWQPPDIGRSTGRPVATLFANPSSPIAAASGTTPGSGTATIYYWNGTTLNSTGQTTTVYNFSPAVSSAGYIPCKTVSGIIVLDYQQPSTALFIGGTLNATLTAGAGNSALCNVAWADNGTSPGSSATVYCRENFFSGPSGKLFQAHWSPEDQKYYFIWVQGTC